ncbi:hypothetical protein [Herbaspirillum sp. ST 5-3]|nr:hypothetical protein [Herbaspirillum sp. ST 5-3]
MTTSYLILSTATILGYIIYRNKALTNVFFDCLQAAIDRVAEIKESIM